MKTMQHSDRLDDHLPASAGTTGDSSVMFSLSALMATETAARTLAATHTSTSAARDESGLIDLSALAAGESPAHLDHLDVFPFGAPAPAEAAAPAQVEDAAATASAKPRRSAVARHAAVALLTALAAGAGLFLGQRAPRAELGPPAAVGFSDATRALAARLPRHDTAAAVTPVATAHDPGARTPANDAPITVAVAQRAPAVRSRSTTGAVTPQARAPQDKVDKRVPPADPCNGDLACAMRRATGG
jgi:hypothetical protein